MDGIAKHGPAGVIMALSALNDRFAKAADERERKATDALQPVIGAPCLVYNVAVCPEKERDPQDTKTLKSYRESFENWRNELNATISRIIDSQDTEGNAEFIDTSKRAQYQFLNEDPKGVPFIGKPFTQFTFVWQGIVTHCLGESHFDYACFSLFADLSDPKTKGEMAEYYKRRVLSAASNSLGDVFEGFWSQFFNDSVNHEYQATSAIEKQEAPRLSLAGNSFSSFRATFDAFRTKPEGGSEGTRSPKDFFPGEVFASQYGLVAEGDSSTAQPFIDAIGATVDKRDLTVSRMLRKSALFIAGMRKEFGVTDWAMLVQKGQDREQLGRLLVDINTLSNLRRMATREFLEFRKLGTYIRLYGHQIDEASKEFNRILDKDGIDIEEIIIEGNFNFRTLKNISVSRSGKERVIKKLTQDMRSLQNDLCRIQAKLYEHSAHFTGGMQFRIFRSKYYIQQFRTRLEGLKIEEIEAYQSYPLFIRRRVEPLFNYIEDAGNRANGLRTRLSSLLEPIQSKTLIDLTKNIEVLSETIVGHAADGDAQTRLVLFITLFLTISQIVHAVIWNNLENAENSKISRIVNDAEIEIQTRVERPLYCAEKSYYRFKQEDVLTAATKIFQCDPENVKSASEEIKKVKNNEPRAAAIAYLFAFAVSIVVMIVLSTYMTFLKAVKFIPKFVIFIPKFVIMVLSNMLRRIFGLMREEPHFR
jgi:hypothetical protein